MPSGCADRTWSQGCGSQGLSCSGTFACPLPALGLDWFGLLEGLSLSRRLIILLVYPSEELRLRWDPPACGAPVVIGVARGQAGQSQAGCNAPGR